MPCRVGIEQLDVRPTVALPPVERGARLVDELLAVSRQRGHRRHPDGQRERGDAERPGAAAQRTRQDVPRDAGRLVRPVVRQQDRELVPADPEPAIRPAQAAEDDPCRGPQELIAPGVSLGLVGLLEVVEIDQQEGDRAGLGANPGDLAVELLLERAVIAETGQPVAQHLQARAVVGVLEPVLLRFARRHPLPGPPDTHPGHDAERHHERQQGDRHPAQLGAGRGRDQQRRPDPQRGARAEPAHLGGATAGHPPRRFGLHPVLAIQSWRSPPTAVAPLYARTGNPAPVQRYRQVRVVAHGWSSG